MHEGRSRSGFAFHLERKGTFWLGYCYRIEMERAETQEQWEAKCAATLSLSGRYAPREIADEWVFQDLTRYLERWPQGEKAGEYFSSLLSTALLETCESLEEDLRSGTLRRNDAELYLRRNAEILRLSAYVSRNPERLRADVDEKEIAALRQLDPCLRKALLVFTEHAVQP
ncbi:MAG: hypothetical protein AB1347_10750 [Acidobacteriota bacterium]